MASPFAEVPSLGLDAMDLVVGMMAEEPSFDTTCYEPNILTEDETKIRKVGANGGGDDKRSIPVAFRGTISDSITIAKEFLEDIKKIFVRNERSKIGTLLTKLISMKYKGKWNIREYIMEMSNVASKLRALKIEISDDLLVHLILISLSTQFG
ncbi:uncharacterized protein [Typha latifolia]|uniref:uncharacterized protein n=1 Tax=Typha latifolia TaxID=4733 RepID=UPI003C2CC75D